MTDEITAFGGFCAPMAVAYDFDRYIKPSDPTPVGWWSRHSVADQIQEALGHQHDVDGHRLGLPLPRRPLRDFLPVFTAKRGGIPYYKADK